MFNMYVFLVVSLCVFGFTESVFVKKETKRHIVDDPLITMFRQQELLLRNIESTMVEKLNKLDAKINSVDLKYEAKANNFSQSLGEIVNMLRKICPTGYVGNMLGCYKIYATRSKADFDAARRQCQNDGAHLLQLHSAEQSARIMKLMTDNGANTGTWYWTGGRKLNNQWTWVDGNVPFTYSNWWQGSYPVRLVGGTNEGRVEIYVASHGGWGIVCDDAWDINDAKVVCRQLGYSGALDAPHRSRYGYGNGQHRVTGVRCTGSETSLDKCARSGWLRDYTGCDNGEAAGVICQGLPAADCVMMLYSPSDQQHSKWIKYPCTSTRPFICEI